MQEKKKRLVGKRVAVTGCTGGLGRELCRYLLSEGASLIMIDRNPKKAASLEETLRKEAPLAEICRLEADMANLASSKRVTESLIGLSPDIFVANAGAYSIPRCITDSGYDNVFQINFVSPYYMARRLKEALPAVRVVVVGSIAHTYSKICEDEPDFRSVSRASKAYGNAKRFLMLSLLSLYGDRGGLAVVHPGITFTGITSHYPKPIFAIIKYPMKLIFMKPQKAVKCIIEGIYTDTPAGNWIGPRIFGIWGKPKPERLKAYYTEDREKAVRIAEKIYTEIRPFSIG